MGEIVCSCAELDVLGEALRIDVRRFPLAIGHHGASREERVRLVERVGRDLTGRGLVRGGDPVPAFAEVLHLLARGPVSVALVGTAGQARPVGLAVVDDRAGVVVVQRGESVTVRDDRPEAAVRALVGLLPAMRPAPGVPVTVEEAPPARAGEDFSEDFSAVTFTSQVRAAAVRSPAAQRAAAEEVLRRPRLGAGYFAVTGRGRDGREVELGTVGYLDTDVGRCAVLSDAGADGRLAVTYAPADQAALDRHVLRIVAGAR
ncbi:ESX secretion-associated protein EspG [Saccharothrix sp. Mg75]|uniref:ESX secretion-associated protein EspG n=1 Tax=Saccharothrix sp. Mg75 TaxID=3445357 RepID=UPI003EECFE1F